MNPDITAYVNLNLFDKDPQDLYDAGQDMLMLNMPDWQPREGQIEVLLMESFATMIAELIYTGNRIPSAVFESLMYMYGIERDYGARPLATATIFVNTTMGVTIPADTMLSVPRDNGMPPVVFTTDEALEIPNGSNSGVVSITGQDYTDEVNGLPPGTPVEVLDSISVIDYALLETSPYEGR